MSRMLQKNKVWITSIAVSLVFIMMFSACTTKSDTSIQSATPAPAATDSAANNEELHKVVGVLLQQNYRIFFDMFRYHQLTLDVPENNDGNDMIFPVKDSTFTTYEQLESYVRSTYVKSFADSLLGEGLYLNRDGKLYGDMSKFSGGGYYVDWKNYTFDVTDITENTAVVTIQTTDSPPNPEGTDEKIDITLTGKLVKENGKWLLENIIQ